MSIFLEHRLVVLRKRSIFELRKAEEKAHILEGLLVALSKLDVVVEIIRRSRKTDSARRNLRKSLKITDVQSRAILDLPLGRLVALERRKIRSDYQDNKRRIKSLQSLLGSDEKQRAAIVEELNEVKKLYQDSRRTTISNGSIDKEISSTDLLPEFSWITFSASGKTGRIDQDTFPRPNTRNRDTTQLFSRMQVSKQIYAFTASGNVARINPRDLPSVDQAHQGQGFAYVSSLPSHEKIVSILSEKFDETNGEFVLLVTERGMVKRIQLEKLLKFRRDPFPILKLDQEDQLITATQHDDDLLLFNSNGRIIRFAADQIRPSGIAAGGVRGMRLKGVKEKVVTAISVPRHPDKWIACVTEEGFAGRELLDEIPRYQRGAQGLLALKMPSNSKGLATAVLGKSSDQILLVSNIGRGRIIRMGKIKEIKRGSGIPAEIVTLQDGEKINRSISLSISSK